MKDYGTELKSLMAADKQRRDQETIAGKMGYSRMQLSRITKQKDFLPEQAERIFKVYPQSLFSGNPVRKVRVVIVDSEQAVRRLEKEISILEDECEENKTALRELNKKFNALVFELMKSGMKNAKSFMDKSGGVTT